MFLHIDCNTFFASCEVASDPSLKGRPVVVANDNEVGGGVILALTPEAKALGLKRGIPLFKVRQQLERDHVVIRPADHRKYSRISRQIMEAVQQQDLVVDFVQYSVDEFFGVMPLDDPDEMAHYARKVKENITATTDIPVSCGCSTTYTLAKTATRFAKDFPVFKGVCVLSPDKRESALAQVKVADIWGVGRQLRKRLIRMDIETALDWALRDEEEMRKTLSTPAFRTYLELRGIPAITLQNKERQKSIMQSHTFGHMVSDPVILRSHLMRFTERCCLTLRKQQSLCSQVSIFISTNPYREDLPQFADGHSRNLPIPSSDTSLIMKAVGSLFDEVYRPGMSYKQAGVILTGIRACEGSQLDLFSEPADDRRRRLMATADSINRKYGINTIHFA